MKASMQRDWAVAFLGAALFRQHVKSAHVVELNQQFKKALQYNVNIGAIEFISVAENTTAVYSALVLERGEVVAEYYRPNTYGTERRNMFGCAKTWTGVIVGILHDAGDIDLDETLGDIFQDDPESGDTEYKNMWDSIGEAEEKKNITIKELLTMTSGLAGTSLNSGGQSLTSALRQDDFIPPSGEFRYLHSNNIISFVLLKKTGKSLEQIAGEKVFPYLGINNSMDVAWQKTVQLNQGDAKTNYAFHGMSISALNAAKLGQLILQGGRHTNTSSTGIVSSTWVAGMTTPHAVQNGNGPNENLFHKYGYLMQIGDADVFSVQNVYCAYGVGQYICIYPEPLDRIFVCQTQFETSFGSDYAVKISTMDFATAVPVVPSTPAPTRLPTSAPTTSPPTSNPTAAPTVTSSGNPSSLPSSSPSMHPSQLPTVKSTNFPSMRFSDSPSKHPTVMKTSPPTSQPTIKPSTFLSTFPSNKPSEIPSILPSTYPSRIPSEIPTILPSYSPSTDLSANPTKSPSLFPSFKPSVLPSFRPTTAPTVIHVPSDGPSEQPTVASSGAILSSSPTWAKSSSPTDFSAVVAKSQPTSSPNIGNGIGTVVPSSFTAPTIQSFGSSVSPTMIPTNAAADVPSRSPSSSPTNIPSRRPAPIPTLPPTRPKESADCIFYCKRPASESLVASTGFEGKCLRDDHYHVMSVILSTIVVYFFT